jgi:hypothetical protein
MAKIGRRKISSFDIIVPTINFNGNEGLKNVYIIADNN